MIVLNANGMKWAKKGAQKIIDLKTIYLNNNWDNIIEFYVNTEQEKLYQKYPKIVA